MKRIIIIIISANFLLSCSYNGDEELLDVTKMWGTYFGESFPGGEAQIFLKGLVDENHSIQNLCFSPGGNEFYFVRTTLDNDSSTIFFSKMINETWTKPKVVQFSGLYNDTDPFIDPSNTMLYFASDRPRPGEEDPWFDFNIWAVERNDTTWSEPVYVEYVNTMEDEYHPSVSNNQTIYFSSAQTGSEGYWDIYTAKKINGVYSDVTKVDAPINSKYRDWDPFISPDESFILFASDRAGGFGGGDIYFARKTGNGNWSEAINLGEAVNTNEYEYCPRLSYDNKFLFFTRLGATGEDFYQDKSLDTRDPFEFIYLPESGRSIVYWIAFDSLNVF